MAVALSFLALAGAVAWDHHHHHHYYPPTPSHHHHDWTPSPHSPPGPSRESAQVHIALGKTKSELNVAWRATDESKESSVEYGTDCSNLDRKVAGDTRKFSHGAGEDARPHAGVPGDCGAGGCAAGRADVAARGGVQGAVRGGCVRGGEGGGAGEAEQRDGGGGAVPVVHAAAVMEDVM
eukprot:TRINITY_DN332_c0_g1_i9.p3 TRINITY_DN332_c0_g1~~TRINITY_DN332_c0_g1_i9.p3  ORF type:complete len:179 (+),score=25.92 TRINITY_DN332_c0_g1_i9:63-599(+)